MTDLLSALPIRGFTFYHFAIRYSPFTIRLFAFVLILLWFLLHSSPLAHAAPPPQTADPATQCTEGVKLFNNGQYDQALPLLEAGFANRAKARFPSLDDEALCAIRLGQLHEANGDLPGALAAYEAVLEIFKVSVNRTGEGIILNSMGKLYYHQGRYDEAMHTYQQALTILREVGDRDTEGTTLNNIGGVYHDQGYYDEALNYYQQALNIIREVGNRAGEGTTLNNIGGVYYNQGHYDDALNYFQHALNIIREVGDRAMEDSILNNIVRIYDSQGRYNDALNYYQQALAVRREMGDQNGEGVTLNNIGNVYRNQGRYDDALDYYWQALSISREMGNRAGEAITFTGIGSVYNSQGRYDEALKAYQQALEISRDVDDKATKGTALTGIGSVYNSQGRYDEALKVYQQALEISRDVGDRIVEGTTHHNIGWVYYGQGRYDEALDYYQQALIILREMGDRTREGVTLTGIGAVYQAQGHYSEALDTYQQALAIRRSVGDRDGEGATLAGMGAVYQAQGHYSEALDAYQQALSIIREVGNQTGEGNIFNNIGSVYDSQGRYDEALKAYQQALEISRDVGDRAGEGATLNNKGAVYNRQGRYDEALKAYQQALEISREVGDRDTEGTTLNNIGNLYDNQGYYDDALNYHQQSLTIRREVGDRVGEGTTLHNIGGVYNNQGHYAEALDYYQQALDIIREVDDWAGKGAILGALGTVYDHQGRYDEAMKAYQQALDIIETVRAMAGSEQGRAGFIAQYTGLYDKTVAMFHGQGQDEQAFFTAERGRARTFLDGLATGQVQLSDDAAADLLAKEQAAYTQRQAAQDALAKAKAANPPDPQLVADLEQQLREAEKAYADAQADIEARGGELADLIPGRNKNVLGVAQVQALLDEQTTLLAYYLLDDKTLAFVLTAQSFQVVELPISRADLTGDVTDFRKFSDTPSGETTRRQAEDLYQTLIAPLAAALTTPHLIIVPHQVLHYLPFAALYDEQAQQYLLEKYTLTVLPSASVLQYVTTDRRPLTAEEQPGSSGAGEQGGEVAGVPALVIGNPTVAGPLVVPVPLTGTEITTATVTFDRLKYAEREAKGIAALYGVQPLLKEAATEGAVRQQVAGARILHLATHGRYNSVVPLDSLIALAPDKGDDGWLTAGEVYGLHLQQTDLVVLSACQTQLGQLSQGDDVVGLTRAFIFAGTPTVVATLWNVDDEATRQLMERFYTHLKAGLGKAEALRQAQVDLIQYNDGQYADPFYWAAFVMSGDGGDSTPAPLPFLGQEPGRWGLGLGLAAGVGVIIGLVWWRRRRAALSPGV